ncbi:PPC domain-containing DNA-binding protein [Microbacterium sp. BWT-B31]|uniref:PPC domain-containing DNA-binding protein n=1 Tax=Microbacterium sp. BWT-B31 TaxID=3232072 RepID=UPI003527E2E4
MQPLVHPGPPTQPRIISAAVRTRRSVCDLQPNRPLVDQLHEALASLGSDSGFAEIHGGDYAPLSYCIPDVGTEERALSFSDTRARERAHLIYGSVTLGLREETPYMHSHCFWQAPDGSYEGGHVWLETAVGEPPPFVTVTAIFDAQWRSATDPETRMPVFTPVERRTAMGTQDSGDVDTIISRVLPNVDITEALLEVCRRAGFERASVRAGLGSLAGATFVDRASGKQISVDGPATEVIALFGDVRTVDGEPAARLSCTLVDRHGEMRAGELMPGENLVAATFELTVQRIDPSTRTVQSQPTPTEYKPNN